MKSKGMDKNGGKGGMKRERWWAQRTNSEEGKDVEEKDDNRNDEKNNKRENGSIEQHSIIDKRVWLTR